LIDTKDLLLSFVLNLTFKVFQFKTLIVLKLKAKIKTNCCIETFIPDCNCRNVTVLFNEMQITFIPLQSDWIAAKWKTIYFLLQNVLFQLLLHDEWCFVVDKHFPRIFSYLLFNGLKRCNWWLARSILT
jgi:hypothetical protein